MAMVPCSGCARLSGTLNHSGKIDQLVLGQHGIGFTRLCAPALGKGKEELLVSSTLGLFLKTGAALMPEHLMILYRMAHLVAGL